MFVFKIELNSYFLLCKYSKGNLKKSAEAQAETFNLKASCPLGFLEILLWRQPVQALI